MGKDRNRVLVIGTAVFVAGLALRGFWLVHQSLWHDEIITYHLSLLSTMDIVASANSINFPPLYFLLTKFMVGFGQPDLMLRLPSLFFGALSISLFFSLLNNWFGKSLAVLGTSILVISPFHVWYSQEARPYMLLIFLSLLALWVLQRLLKDPNNLMLQFMTVVTTAATFYCHFLSIAFIGFVFVCILMSFQDQSLKYRLVLCVSILFLMVPGFLRILAISPDASANSYSTFSLASIGYLIWSFSTGYSLGPSLVELHAPDPFSALLPHLKLVIPIMIFITVLLVSGLSGLWKKDRLMWLNMVMWFSLPLVLAVLGAFLSDHPFNVRYAILSFPPFILFMAFGITSFKNRWLRIGTFVLLSLISLVSLRNYFISEKYHREDNRSAGLYLAEHAQPRDLVVASAGYTAMDLRYYYQGPNEVQFQGYPIESGQNGDHDSIIDGAQFVDPNRLESDLQILLKGRKRFWLFLSRTFHSDPQGLIRSFCETNFKPELHASWSGTELILFSTEKRNLSSLNIEKSSEQP